MPPRNDCNEEMGGEVVSLSITRADGTVVGTHDLDSGDSFSYTQTPTQEGVYTYSTTLGRVPVHRASVHVAPVFVTIDSTSVGVSGVHSTLTGLPSTAKEEYSASLTLRDIGGTVIQSDISPTVAFAGSSVVAVWEGYGEYSVSGTAGDEGDYTMTVAVGGVTILTEAVTLASTFPWVPVLIVSVCLLVVVGGGMWCCLSAIKESEQQDDCTKGAKGDLEDGVFISPVPSQE
ncbi:hypothetical protein KIPB_002892 [Kipferlia bialata]|uniref:Uncharacterized protein n=1 Tax=Kipferlia bialata TaxID=797122 RepID=A0A391NMP9_9EUKA|nr:hypothetical protein KIPB_002892 [Kipferlia bialata]|eukprot:g2892.t1